MDKFEVYQNGNFVDGRPVFQIGVKQDNGSYAIVDADLMSEEEAKARLKELQPAKKAAAKKEKEPAKKEPAKKAAKKK
jgi:topoisomerase IA-like protein